MSHIKTIKELAEYLIERYPNWITVGELMNACKDTEFKTSDVLKEMMRLTNKE